MDDGREISTDVVAAKAQLLELRRGWQSLCYSLYAAMLMPLVAGWCIWESLDPAAAALRNAALFLVAFWFALLWLPLPVFSGACRRQIALSFMHAAVAREVKPELLLPMIEYPRPSLFERLSMSRRQNDAERQNYIYQTYLRPLAQMQTSYELACAGAGQRPYPPEYILLRLLPAIYGAALLCAWISLIFQGLGGLGLGLLLAGAVLIPILHAQYQLAVQGHLLRELELAQGG